MWVGFLVPELWSLLGGNLLYLVAAELVYQSIRLLDGEKASRAVYLYVVAPAIVLTLLARYVVDAYSACVVIMSAAISLLLALASRRLFMTPSGTRSNPGRRAAAFFFAPMAASVLRAEVLAWPAAVMCMSHGVSFITNLVATVEYRNAGINELMMRPHGRVMVLHLNLVARVLTVDTLETIA